MQDITTRALTIPEAAKGILVVDTESFEAAGNILKTIKSLRQEIDNTFDPIIKKAHEAHKEAIDQKKRADAPLVQAESIIKPRLASYHAEKLRIAAEAQRKAQEEIDRKAQEEKLQQALLAEKNGNTAKADAILNSPIISEKAEVDINIPKVSGISFRGTWKAEVVDEQAFFKAVFEGKIPISAISINTTFLNSQARLQKEKLNYPGIKVTCSTGVASGKS